MKLKPEDLERAERYADVPPKQLGNLHERMKYVLEAAGEIGHDRCGSKLWHALFDLETELKYYAPAKPPFARRTAPVSEFFTSGGRRRI